MIPYWLTVKRLSADCQPTRWPMCWPMLQWDRILYLYQYYLTNRCTINVNPLLTTSAFTRYTFFYQIDFDFKLIRAFTQILLLFWIENYHPEDY